MNGPHSSSIKKAIGISQVQHLIDVSRGLGSLSKPPLPPKKKSIKYRKRADSFNFSPI